MLRWKTAAQLHTHTNINFSNVDFLTILYLVWHELNKKTNNSVIFSNFNSLCYYNLILIIFEFSHNSNIFISWIMLFIIKGFRTVAFIIIVISTAFRLICPLAFFRCLSNLGTFTEFRTTSFIESTRVACSDSVSHNQVQVLSIPVLLLAFRWLSP